MTEVEATFEVPVPPAAAWNALAAAGIARTDPEQQPMEWWIPGFESTAVEVERSDGARLTVRKTQQPCEGTLIAITFEHIATGTRVRVVQSGFDEDFVRGGGEAFWIHSEQIFADLELFLRTGVVGRRAWRPMVWLGVGGITTSYGVVVHRVAPDSWADRIGLREGDVLLTVEGAPLFSTRDLGTVQRLVRVGDEVAATWARAGEHCEEAASA
jgi:hypothetical protein